MALLFAASHPDQRRQARPVRDLGRACVEADDFDIGFSPSQLRPGCSSGCAREWGGPVLVPLLRAQPGGRPGLPRVVGADACAAGRARGAAVELMQPLQGDRRPPRPARDRGAHARPARSRTTGSSRQALAEHLAEAYPGRPLFRVAGPRTTCSSPRTRTRCSTRSRTSSSARAPVARAGAATRDRPLHRHRRIDRPRGRGGRPALARRGRRRTTRSSARRSPAIAAKRSRRWATVSSPRSTAGPRDPVRADESCAEAERIGVPVRPASTPASATSWATTSRASR